MQFSQVKMNVQSASESLFLMEQFQKQVVSLKSSEVYLSIDIKYVGVTTTGSTAKIHSEVLHAGGIQCICEAMAQ